MTSYVYTGPVQMIALVSLFFAFYQDSEVDVLDQVGVIFTSFGAGLGDGQAMSSHLAVYGLVYLQVRGGGQVWSICR